MLRTFQTSLTLSQVLSFDILSMVNKKRTTVRQPKEEILYFDKKMFNVPHEFTSSYSCISIFTKHFFREKRTNRTISIKYDMFQLFLNLRTTSCILYISVSSKFPTNAKISLV